MTEEWLSGHQQGAFWIEIPASLHQDLQEWRFPKLPAEGGARLSQRGNCPIMADETYRVPSVSPCEKSGPVNDSRQNKEQQGDFSITLQSSETGL